ncbi:MAG TPA: hypothetical protein DCX89_01655 [Saprospirales bacterium]|nr:hypothetical protein [Saprospirales bacterium]HAY70572.1 hypothetical protein [Saprospirales bacterium]HRQ28553.1 type II toxin-antitoxin system RelE/ParE family toxin [Saprospiraceae bacterium]
MFFKRIDKAILSLEEEPRPIGCIKLKSSSNLYRIRVGAYRIVYLINDTLRSVDLRLVEHRKQAYNRK